MNEKPLNELIDDFVSGQVSPDDKAYLEALASKDPEVRSQLDATKVAYDFLERSYYRDVKKKLQAYDRAVETTGDLSSKKTMRFMFAGVILVAIFWMISWWYHQPENLARRYYYPLGEQMKQVYVSDTVSQLRILAEKDFLNNDFVKAGISFQMIIADSAADDRMHAEWNHLLCQLAVHGHTRELRHRLDEVIDRSDEPVKGKAMQLKKQLNSRIYNLTFFQFSPELSSLKPRLI